MGDQYQVAWVRSLIETMPLQPPILEIGSRREPDNAAFFDYRTLFPADTRYVGIDIEAGDGVDRVCDLSEQNFLLKMPLVTFQTVLCLSTLEHVRDPWTLARNLMDLLAPGAVVVVSAPFSWRLHEYPDDFWRFSPSGLRALFPTVAFDDTRSCLCTCSGRAVSLNAEGALDFLRFQGIVVGTASYGTFACESYIVQPASFVSEGVNVNMVGRHD